ncbi:MAG: hypothetical protein WBY94_24640 [Polyangiaceae bacterium]
MLTDSAVFWYAFSGDAAAVQVAREALVYQLGHALRTLAKHVRAGNGNAEARDLGARSLNWATYACRDDGIVTVA